MKKRIAICILSGIMMMTGAAYCFAEAETEAAVTAAEGEAAALSDDIYSFQIMINDEVYAFPMSYAEFTSRGWTYSDDDTQEISPNSYSSSEVFSKDGLKIYADVINLGINTVSIAEATIGGISIDAYYVQDAPETHIELPGSIVYGEATIDDIKAAYGEPSDTYEGSMYTELTYSYDYYQEVELQVDIETGVLSDVDVRNFVYDEEANAAAQAEVSDEPTPEVLAYEAPAEASEDLMDYVVEYTGDLYKLPAPVSVFLENGFTLKESESDMIIAGGSYGWATMMKNNQEFRTIVNNYNANATTIQNCFVTSIDADVYDENLTLTIAGGLTVGMSADELEAALDNSGYSYEKNTESSDSYTYYSVEDAGSSLDGYDFTVRNEDGVVTSVEVSYQPRSLD